MVRLGAAIAGLVPVVFIAVVATLWMGVHKIEEGHIGLYWFGGALEETYSEPGWHTMIPWVTRMAEVTRKILHNGLNDLFRCKLHFKPIQ